jgi:hypothetical protein
MTAAGQVYAGSRETAAMLQGVAPLSAYKATNQPGSGSTLANDSALVIPLQANAVYDFELILGYFGGTQGSSDIKLGWSLPSGASMGYTVYGNTTGGNPTDAPWYTASSTPALGTNGTGTNIGAILSGTVSVGANAGNMQLQWARNAGSGTAPTVLAGSILLAWQVQ